MRMSSTASFQVFVFDTMMHYALPRTVSVSAITRECLQPLLSWFMSLTQCTTPCREQSQSVLLAGAITRECLQPLLSWFMSLTQCTTPCREQSQSVLLAGAITRECLRLLLSWFMSLTQCTTPCREHAVSVSTTSRCNNTRMSSTASFLVYVFDTMHYTLPRTCSLSQYY